MLLLIPLATSFAIMIITIADSWLSFAVCLSALLLGVLSALPFATPPSLSELLARRAVSHDDTSDDHFNDLRGVGVEGE